MTFQKWILVVLVSCTGLNASYAEDNQPNTLRAEVAKIEKEANIALAKCTATFQVAFKEIHRIKADREARGELIAETNAYVTAKEFAAFQEAVIVETQCSADAHNAASEKLAALATTLELNGAALRAETASLKELLAVLQDLETLAKSQGKEHIADAIEALQSEASASDTQSATFAAQTECIYHLIATDAVLNCKDPKVYSAYLAN